MAAAAGAWGSWIFAAVFAGMAIFFAVRLLAFRRDTSEGDYRIDRSAEASHGVMSLGMAAMFWPWGNPVPALYWQVLFSVVAAWFVVRMLRPAAHAATILSRVPVRGADLHHVLGSLAMVYMLAGVPAGHHMTHGMEMVTAPGIALPALAWAFVAYFLAFAVWLGARLVEPVNTVAAAATAATLGAGPRGVVTSPHLFGSSRIVMGIGMSYMFVTVL